MIKIKDKSILAIAKCTQTIYFDYDSDYIDFDNPKDMYPLYEFGYDYCIIAKKGYILEILYDEEAEQYTAFSKNGGSVSFINAKELSKFEGFEIIKFYDKELERLCLK